MDRGIINLSPVLRSECSFFLFIEPIINKWINFHHIFIVYLFEGRKKSGKNFALLYGEMFIVVVRKQERSVQKVYIDNEIEKYCVSYNNLYLCYSPISYCDIHLL